MGFQSIRKEYESAGIVEADLLADPIEMFKVWYELAIERCPGRWFEPNAMSLATADLDGNVSNRFVLLKGIEPTGIQFFTNYDSEKGRQLAANPKCSVAFHWPYLGRQVRIVGEVTKTSREVSETYFHSRPRGSQISAAASLQSSEVVSREELESQQTAVAQANEDQEIPLPENWGGYLIKATRFEFWQGRLDRLHDRIIYRLVESGWERCRLSP